MTRLSRTPSWMNQLVGGIVISAVLVAIILIGKGRDLRVEDPPMASSSTGTTLGQVQAKYQACEQFDHVLSLMQDVRTPKIDMAWNLMQFVRLAEQTPFAEDAVYMAMSILVPSEDFPTEPYATSISGQCVADYAAEQERDFRSETLDRTKHIL